MMLNPSVQKKAQAEIDRVVGAHGRLPTIEDRPRLPYVEAVMKEAMRWNPVVPMGKSLCLLLSCVFYGIHELLQHKDSRICQLKTMSIEVTSFRKVRSSCPMSGELNTSIH